MLLAQFYIIYLSNYLSDHYFYFILFYTYDDGDSVLNGVGQEGVKSRVNASLLASASLRQRVEWCGTGGG